MCGGQKIADKELQEKAMNRKSPVPLKNPRLVLGAQRRRQSGGGKVRPAGPRKGF